ncbi:MAG: fimbrillin family protein [Bacteroidaceae bacterium]|nr:fimbrillin family protein [Bacteroidaceae bacterium]
MKIQLSKMRNPLLLALVSLMALCSCSQEEALVLDDDDLVEIKIGVAHEARVETKGVGTVGGMDDGVNNWDGQLIRVAMLHKGTLEYAQEEGVNLLDHSVMLQTPKGKENGAVVCVDGKIKYFPAQGAFDFWGYHLDNAAEGNDVRLGDDKMDLRVAFRIDGSQDLMVAKAVPTAEDSLIMGESIVRAFSSYAARKGLASGKAGSLQPKLEFRHLLTRLVFQVVGGTAKVCQNGGSEIYVDSVKVRTKTKGDLVIAYLGSESKDQVVFDNTKEWTILKERADEKVQNADLVKMNPVVPAVGTNGKPVPTDLGEALLVAPDVEYDIVVYLHQNVVATTDGKSEMKSYSYSTTLKNFNDEKAGFEHGRSYNVQISLWGLSQITVTTKLDKWNDGGNIDMPIEDLDVPRI